MGEIPKIYEFKKVVDDELNNFKNKLIPLLFGIYCASLMIQNVLATKTIDIAAFTVTTGILISPLVFIIQDVSSELFGYKQTKKMILLSFAMNFLAVILFQLAIALPASDAYVNQEAFSTILGSTVRIVCASFCAYLCGSLINTKIMVALKAKNEKKLFVRAITSTAVGQFCDNAIFAFGAFAFVLPVPVILSIIAGGTLFEVIYEIIFYPVTKKLVTVLAKTNERQVM